MILVCPDCDSATYLFGVVKKSDEWVSDCENDYDYMNDSGSSDTMHESVDDVAVDRVKSVE